MGKNNKKLLDIIDNNKMLGYSLYNKTLGDGNLKREKLIQYRKNKKWSQKRVVEELSTKHGIKITDSYYGMIEKGVRSPSLKLAVSIAKIFKVRPENIFLNNNTTKSCGDDSKEVI
ncbi:helix-turn-helix transcriptional regulator [Halobacillus sp. SY10]|uniref:helix-turn-helix transcriptional regulator n=1 Tax=Halobacillus sp. SY10 TaxID=3381356 RepID=UPI00387901F7